MCRGELIPGWLTGQHAGKVPRRAFVRIFLAKTVNESDAMIESLSDVASVEVIRSHFPALQRHHGGRPVGEQWSGR